jgi:type II secretory pathway component GspD/PulD (secretin)
MLARIFGSAALVATCFLALCGPAVQFAQAVHSRSKPLTAAQEAALDQKIVNQLNAPVTLNFTDAPLTEVLEAIRQLSRINIWCDDAAVLNEGIDVNRPVTVKVENITLKSALTLILKPCRLTYLVKDQVLQITTEREAAGKMVTTAYLVADLVIPVGDFSPPSTLPIAPLATTNMVLKSVPAQGEPTPCDAYWISPNTGAMGNPQEVRQTRERQLIDLITRTIAPYTWSEFGGQGSIDFHPLTMALVVNQTPDVQEQVAELLSALRRMQDVQVALEVRFLAVSDAYWDALNHAALGNRLDGCGAQFHLDMPASLDDPAFLNDQQVAMMLDVGQNTPGANILHAPKITLFNGQKGTVCISDAQDFTMTAQPVVSADHHSVRLSLKIEPTDLASKEASKTLDKTVAIPDGGTVMFSGLKKVTEARNEYGPPIISKIPYLNRLFKNVAYSREEHQVLVLVTPRIIVNEQEEYKEVEAKGRDKAEVCPVEYRSVPPVYEGQETPAKKAKSMRQDKVMADLLRAYDEACTEGRNAEAKKLARAALIIDPTCFRRNR